MVTIAKLGIHYELCIKEEYIDIYKRYKDLNVQFEEMKNSLGKKQQIIQDQLMRLRSSQSMEVNVQRSIPQKRLYYQMDEQSSSMVQAQSTRSPVGSGLPRVQLKPIFILDEVSNQVSSEKISTLKQLILEKYDRENVSYPLRPVFEPIMLVMNTKFKGDWRTMDANRFNRERAKYKLDREIHFAIDWNMPTLRTTDHVTFDLGSMYPRWMPKSDPD